MVYTLEGRVFDSNGAPAGKAVVFTADGGRSTTNVNGWFRLRIAAGAGVDSTRITAVGGSGGKSTASARVPLPRNAGIVNVGPITLEGVGSCSPSWLTTFGPGAGMKGIVYSFAVFDDGTGPALYVGGQISEVGGCPVENIAKWDGSNWSDVGSGVTGNGEYVYAMTVFDDGSGPALFVAGSFFSAGAVSANGIAKWDGSAWSPLDSGISGPFPEVRSLAVFDDGTGPALYAAGAFFTASGQTVNHIARWDGVSWSGLGTGSNNLVFSLAVHDDGSGPALYAGGQFTLMGGIAARSIARWDGTSWSQLQDGIQGQVYVLASHDDGNGPALFVGGEFDQAGSLLVNCLARWSGSTWSTVGTGTGPPPDEVRALAVFDDGTGPALFAGGIFDVMDGLALDRVAKWNGTSWSGLDSGVTGAVFALSVFDDGLGTPKLYLGGGFTLAGGEYVRGFCSWDGSSFEASSVDGLSGPSAYALASFDDGGGPALYVGGRAMGWGGTFLETVAKWNGSSWVPIGGGIDGEVFTLCVFDDGSGPALFAGGSFTTVGGVSAQGIARWDGTSWSSIGDLPGDVEDLIVFDDGTGPALYAAGSFTTAGGVPANRVAKWDGTSWTSFGTGLNGVAYAVHGFDDGSGPAIYVGGGFSTAGGQPANRIAKWDGTSWAPLGTGADLWVVDFASFDDGSGPALFVAGWFKNIGGQPASGTAKWDGATWSPVGQQSNWQVYALTVYDDGSGPDLYGCGAMQSIGQIGKWDGSTWSALGSGLSVAGLSLASFDDGTGNDLYVGGSAIDSKDTVVSRWSHAGPFASPYCTAKTSSAGCVSVVDTIDPCAAPVSGGNDYAVTASNVQEIKNGLVFVSISGAAALPFSGGTLCLQPPLKRGPIMPSGGDNPLECDGSYSTIVNDGQVVPTGLDPGSGNSAWYQYWYRDPQNGPGVLGTALSNAVQLDFQ